MGEAPSEGGFLLEGPERDGHEGLGQVPLSILPPPKNQRTKAPQVVSWWLEKEWHYNLRIGKRRKTGGSKQKGLGRKAVWQGSVNSWVSQLWDTKS